MPKKILLIDDEELITRTLAKALERQDYEVLVAKNGQDAVVMAEAEEFDLIVSDIRMPGLDGVETVRRIFEALKERGAKKIPTIFVTGYANQDIEEMAKALNPHAYVFKPFDYSEFLGRVKEALEA